MGLLKWVGGKSREAKLIISYFPRKEDVDVYFEPFVGAGSCLLEYRPSKFVINDVNYDLMRVYRALRYSSKTFLEELEALVETYKSLDFNGKQDFYYQIRSKFNDTNLLRTAHDFYFLISFSYNGLCRYNSKGELNSPWGKDTVRFNLEAKRLSLENIASYLQEGGVQDKVMLMGDYYKQFYGCNRGRPEDFVYFDPPYHETYNSYDKTLVKEPFDQLTFFNRCIKNTQSRWLVTNSGTSFIRDLYKDFTIIDLPASRVVGPKHSRKKVNDIIIKNY